MIDPCDCAPRAEGPRIDADGRCFTCSGDMAHVREKIRMHRLARGDKPASAAEDAAELATKLFDQEVP